MVGLILDYESRMSAKGHHVIVDLSGLMPSRFVKAKRGGDVAPYLCPWTTSSSASFLQSLRVPSNYVRFLFIGSRVALTILEIGNGMDGSRCSILPK